MQRNRSKRASSQSSRSAANKQKQRRWTRPWLEALESRDLPSTLFATGINYPIGTTAIPAGIARGDLNGDSVQDLVVADSSTNQVSVFIGNADGTFQTAVNYAAGTDPVSVALGNFTGHVDNNHNDIIVANESTGQVSLLTNKGTGTFSAAAPFSTLGTNPVFVAVGDFNGDKSLDVAVANIGNTSSGAGSSVSILLGTGAGNFQKATQLFAGNGIDGIAVDDFNGDSSLDLAVANRNSNSVSVFLGNGDGNFKPPLSSATGAGPVGLVSGDFNGDKSIDVATANQDGTVSVLLGNGDGKFKTSVNYAAGGTPTSIAVNDVNGDKTLDLLVTNQTSNAVGVLLGNSDGTFAAPGDFATGVGPVSIVTGDFNADSKIDFATADASGVMSVVFGNGDGTFPEPISTTTDLTPTSVAQADLNGDLIPDLIVANKGANDLNVLLGNGDGHFKPPAVYTVGNAPTDVVIGNFNGSSPFVAVTNSGDGTVSILPIAGNGTLGVATTVTVGKGPIALAVGEFDGDTNQDIAVVNQTDGTVSILQGNGDGTFKIAAGAKGTIPVGTGPSSVAVGKFGTDTNTDLVVTNQTDGTITILQGNGDGSFKAATPITVGKAPSSVAVGFFNGDKFADLAVANSGDNTISVLLGNSDGTFKVAKTLATGFNPQFVSFGDFNGTGNQGDGNLDLVVANKDSGDVSVFLGNGDGTFGPATNYIMGAGATSVAVADYNGDGAQDIAGANSAANAAAVILDETQAPLLHLVAPANVTAGSAFTITVSAYFPPSTSTIDTAYRGTVHFTSTDTKAGFPADYKFTAADNGVHTFTLGFTLGTPGSQTITGTDKVNKSITGNVSVNVKAAALDHFEIFAPANSSAGSAFTVTVFAEDKAGNTVTDYTGTVHFTSSDKQATLPADTIFAATDKGVHTFTNGVTLKTAGNQTITVADKTTPADKGSTTVNVSPLSASTLSITAPGSVTAGNSFTTTVTALDQYGNTATSYFGNIHFTSSDGTASLPLDFSFGGGDQGVHTFVNGVTLDTAGKQTVTVTDTSSKAITGTATTTVNAAAAQSLTIDGPSTSSAGTAFTITVTAFDKFNNVATSYLDTVAFTSTDGAANLPANYKFVTADSGVHTFSSGVTLNTAGPQSVKATDTSNSSVNGTLQVTVAHGPATHYSFVGPPSTTATIPFGMTLTAFDKFNNVANDYMGTVHFTSTDKAAALPPDYTFLSGDQGVHMFPSNAFTLNTVGSQDIVVADNAMPTKLNASATIKVNLVYLATGTDQGGGPEVKVISPTTGSVKFDFYAYDSRFLGGVRTAVADINHDGIPDIITAPGPTGGPDIRIFDGKTGNQIFGFYAYSPAFTGGVFVAAGDVNHDGYPDIITGADAGGGPHVNVYDGKDLSQGKVTLLYSFYAYDPGFGGGVRVAAGDVNGDGFADIITGAGAGGGPHVRVFDGKTGLQMAGAIGSFYAYDSNFSKGVYVAAGDINGDTKADIMVGAGTQSGPDVKTQVFSGADGSILQSFFAYDPGFGGGVHVALADVDSDGKADIITGPGPSGGPQIQVLDGLSLAVLDSFYAYSSAWTGGVFVGAA